MDTLINLQKLGAAEEIVGRDRSDGIVGDLLHHVFIHYEVDLDDTARVSFTGKRNAIHLAGRYAVDPHRGSGVQAGRVGGIEMQRNLLLEPLHVAGKQKDDQRNATQGDDAQNSDFQLSKTYFL